MSNPLWKKRDGCETLKDVIERNVGISIEEFMKPLSSDFILNLDNAVNCIEDAISKSQHITVFGDYDADGITSSAILYHTLKQLGCDSIDVRLPRRFSEGYGITEKAVQECEEGLLITVDNGIAAVEAIAAAKAKGLTVVVLDHHLLREDGILPDADVIVDPSAIPGSDFEHYCGAGLAYKLACKLVKDNMFLKRMSCLAAIGTVADVMPLIGDNRQIVIEGLKNINAGVMPRGLNSLLQELGVYSVNETDIGFRLGPILNAAGRLYDDGAAKSFALLVSSDSSSTVLARELIKINEERKETVAYSMEVCEQIIAEQCLFGECPLVVYTTKNDTYQFNEGIVGIIAGRLSEQYKCPAIVLTETEEGFKGSGRSNTVHLKETLDKVLPEYFVKYGGHAGAAGLTIKKECIEDFKMAIQEVTEQPETFGEEIIYYDILITPDEIPRYAKELLEYAPFGQGNPMPVFLVENAPLIPKAGAFHKKMGAEGQHLRLFGKGFNFIAFNMSQKYEDLGEPLTIDSIGQLSINTFAGKADVQMECLDIEKSEISGNKTALGDLLANALAKKGFK